MFENERGKHAVCLAHCDLEMRNWVIDRSNDGRLISGLRKLTEEHGQWILASAYFAGHSLGMSTFAVEGYFDETSAALPVIVDIDLPTDFAWN